jgi:hypothetical protein
MSWPVPGRKHLPATLMTPDARVEFDAHSGPGGAPGQSIEIGRRCCQEFAYRGDRAVGVEALVFSLGEAHKALGGADRGIKPLPEGDRNDAVEFAVQHQVGTVIAPIRASERN